jgi:hypothetical protein
MCEQVTIERIDRGIVDIWGQHTFAQIVENDDFRCASQATEGDLVQLAPDP